MKLLIGDYGHVDFAAPVAMSDAQKAAFIAFLKTRYDEVDVSQFTEREFRLGERKRFFSAWSNAELRVLLDPITNDEALERLGRSWMSVNIKRGNFLPKFNAWLSEQGLQSTADYERLIGVYMKEKAEDSKKLRETTRLAARLLKCPACGLFHDPETYRSTECYRCGKRLVSFKVDPLQKRETYLEQPEYNGEDVIVDELLTKYPPRKD